MEELNNITVNPVDPTTFEYQEYSEQDNNLISSSRLDTAFTSSTDYIEYYIYDNSQQLIFPLKGSSTRIYDQRNYSVLDGDVVLFPSENLEDIGFDDGTFYSTYNFYRKQLASDQFLNYYICEISADRTEVRLKSSTIPADLIVSSSNAFIEYRENADYFVDFLLNFGGDQQVIANNLRLDTTTEIEPSLLVKLYEPLPDSFSIKDTLWFVEEISTPQAYTVTFPPIEFIPDDSQFIKGPNYSISVTQQTGESTQDFSFNTLLSSNVTSSTDQLKNILDRKEIDINVDYTDYNNFIKFSSAQTRLENFYYKVGLIQSSSNAIEALTTNDGFYSSSKAEISTSIQKVITGFDRYEYFLYYDSGSIKSYPKSTTTPPYILMPTGSTEVKTWLGSANPENAFYGGQALVASDYDDNNKDYLYNTIPEYLRSDPNNEKYELFVDMVAQQYDNTWLYTKNITTRFDADNRLDYGISKDLVADAIRDFGVKLYSNNFNTSDLYTAFLGLTPSGSTFPLPNMVGLVNGIVNTPTGFEYIDTQISASDNIVPLDDVNKRLYKRIYHNMPYLLKTKGTVAGLRALITSYGIPDTILRINEFGGKDRDNYLDWDYSENVFNYAFHAEGTNSSYFNSSFEINTDFQTVNTAPRSLQFRFKTPGIPLIDDVNTAYYYNIWRTDENKSLITLEYTGSGTTSGSYSGSTPAENNAYGTLTFWPDGDRDTTNTASISLPFFDGGWWSAMVTVDYNVSDTAKLFAANRIDDKIGFTASDSSTYNWQYYATSISSSFFEGSYEIDSNMYVPFTGAFQELRYWDTPLSESLFYDYVVNPYSTQGNTINSTPDDLVFRADLGTQLITSSRKSIHPKVTGSWETTSSFSNGFSDFYLIGNFIENTEEIYLNQVPGGIKNRISDQITIDKEVLPSGSTLSPYRSIQQETFPSGSDPSINYLEVAFSPTDQVNDDIIAQVGAFNLGDYIGDPRQVNDPNYSYPALDKLRDEYFTKYIDSYDVNDFIRLISFFDNSLFKMIEDFTPARTSLSSGVVIKQNLLERNRQRPVQVSTAVTMSTYFENTPADPFSVVVPIVQKDQVLEGTVLAQARDFNPGSNDYPQSNTISGSSIYVFDGGTGGVFEPFNNINNAPVSSSTITTCFKQYYYLTGSLGLAETNEGSVLFDSTITQTTNTMSWNVSNDEGTPYTEYFNSLTSSISQSGLFVNIGTERWGSVTYKVDYIDRLPASGYGEAEYSLPEVRSNNKWGYQTTASFIAYLSNVEDNVNPNARDQFLIDLEQLNPFCFTVDGTPYSGKTTTEVSASTFAAQYPGVVQDFTEYVVPSIGTGFPAGSSNETNPNLNGVGLVPIQRIDQREFYNGEFPNTIEVGLKDICSAFFGQNDIPDYQFYIQWLNEKTLSESQILSTSFLPDPRNILLWADTLSDPKVGSRNLLGINTLTGVPTTSATLTADTTLFTYSKISGNGNNKGTIVLQSDGTKITTAYFKETPFVPKNYEGDGIITILQSTLSLLGFTGIAQNLILNLGTQQLSPIPTNKVKYIKMANSDINDVTILPFITDSEYITLNLTGASDYNGNLIEGFQTWFISNSTIQSDNNQSTPDATLLIIDEAPSSEAVTSFDGGFVDLSFKSKGQFVYDATSSGVDPTVLPTTTFSSSVPQGYFPPTDRSPAFPTESFFRGWADATYFETNEDGSVSKVSAGSGFNTDTLGNFNIGATETDNDDVVPYLPSITPWFMNAPASTNHFLINSSTVGGNLSTDLQLYTGSITASSVPIGPSFQTIVDPTPTEAPNQPTPIVDPVVAGITSITWSPAFDTGIPQFSTVTYPITINCGNNNVAWEIYVQYPNGHISPTDDFVSLWPTVAGGTPTFTTPTYRITGTGTTTVYAQWGMIFNSDLLGSRFSTFKVVNTNNTANNFMFTPDIEQERFIFDITYSF